MRTPRKRVQFLTMGVVLLVVVLGTMVFTGWFAYHGAQQASAVLKSANQVSSDVPKLAAVDSFATCQNAAGSKLLETYPEQCVTSGGKTFVGPTKQVLVIKEWGVKVEYTSTDTLSYKLSETGNGADVISKDLAQKYGCTDWGAGGIFRQVGSDDEAGGRTGDTVAESYKKNPSYFTKIGSYYYSFAHNQAGCQSDDIMAKLTSAQQEVASNLQNKTNDFVETLVSKLVPAN